MGITIDRNLGFERFQIEKKDQILNYEIDILIIEIHKGKRFEQVRKNVRFRKGITNGRELGFERFQIEKKDQILNYRNDILIIEIHKGKRFKQGRNFRTRTETKKMNRHKTMNKDKNKEQKDMT